MDNFLVLSQYKGALVLAFLLTFFVLGSLIPFSTISQARARIANNLALSGFNAVLAVLIVMPVTVFASHWTYEWRPDSLQGLTGLIVDLVLLDLWIYLWHRTEHAVPFLWRFHEVHHLDETLDATSALRFHFGEVFLSSLVRLPIIMLLAIPLQHIVLFETMVAMAAIFHHSNLRLPQYVERALSWFIVTPSIHWVHHHAIRADTDSNYAVFFSIWDKLFLSQSRTIRRADLVIGVEGRSDQSFIKLLVWPIHKSNSRSGNLRKT
jgi:sterol desaturase/sphingolipid hydroxylase (fatty acid hydroxylase superfamily)